MSFLLFLNQLLRNPLKHSICNVVDKQFAASKAPNLSNLSNHQQIYLAVPSLFAVCLILSNPLCPRVMAISQTHVILLYRKRFGNSPFTLRHHFGGILSRTLEILFFNEFVQIFQVSFFQNYILQNPHGNSRTLLCSLYAISRDGRAGI